MSNTKVNTGLTLRDLNQGDKFRFKSDPETRVRRLSQKGKIEGYCPYDGQNTMGHSMSTGDEVYFLGKGDIILINDELKVNTEPKELFTPGEWHINDRDGVSIVSQSKLIADVRGGKKHSELTANAQLIAAAPDLYEALKKLKNVATETTRNLIAWDGADILDKAIDQAIEALKKANPNYKP